MEIVSSLKNLEMYKTSMYILHQYYESIFRKGSQNQ